MNGSLELSQDYMFFTNSNTAAVLNILKFFAVTLLKVLTVQQILKVLRL